jgi:peptide/nickel transport system substrate-binding protein
MADANLFTRGRARNFQIQLVGWGTGYPDADAMISRHAVDPDSRPEAKLAQYPVWRTGWEDAGVNKTAEEARREPDPAKRIALYHQLQDYMMQNGPMAYIYQGIRSLGVRDEVKGLQLNAFNVDYWSATK